MAVKAAIAFAAFFLEDKNLVAFNERHEDLTVNFCSFHGRSTDFHVAVGVEKQNFVERNGVAFFHFIAEMVHIQKLAFFGFELLTFDFYDCVHFIC